MTSPHGESGPETSGDGGARPGGESDEDDDGWKLFARDLATSVTAVLLLGAYLFAISGVWPPMVAIESGSMQPNMEVNDLAFVMDNDRFQPEGSVVYEDGNETVNTGVVTAANGEREGYTQFGDSGDVIVYEPDGQGDRTPIIHRAMFWVEEDEDWTDRANPEFLGGATTCEEIETCPAPHGGFITKGDDNTEYDQVGGLISDPVKPEWVVGTAEIRIPRLGWFRLRA